MYELSVICCFHAHPPKPLTSYVLSIDMTSAALFLNTTQPLISIVVEPSGAVDTQVFR